jgi:ATP synthase protein I
MQRKQEATDSPESFDDTNSVPWTKERVLEFRKAEPPVSVWWVVLTQMSVGLMTVFVAWLLGAKFASMASLGYGSFCVVLPSIIFARGITSKWSSLNPGAAVTGFFLWEFVKVAMTVVMLVMSQSLVDDLSWPMMMLGLIITMKVYWLSFLWQRKG